MYLILQLEVSIFIEIIKLRLFRFHTSPPKLLKIVGTVANKKKTFVFFIFKSQNFKQYDVCHVWSLFEFVEGGGHA